MADKTPISVFCRVKPYTGDSLHETQNYEIRSGPDKDTLAICSQQNSANINHKPDFFHFQFSKVFDQDASQELVYDTVAKSVVQSTLRGYNGTVFAYGQTGSGKTFTISGDTKNQGIVPRALKDIFNAINTLENDIFEVRMSYMEIYNEHIIDLLIPGFDEKKKILLRANSDKIMQWHNLSIFTIGTFSEAMKLLSIGENNRIVRDTPMNVFSSRSHTVLTIYLAAQAAGSEDVHRAKLNLIDLAGSERIHKMGEEGIVIEEARHINLSLHYLEQVIVALSDSRRTHVPYRNCTMTSVLRDSLGGNCKTVMVANIAIDKANYEETVSTCRFAHRVALVRNEVMINLTKDLSGENSRLREQILHLKNRCTSLQAQVQELNERSVQEDCLAFVEEMKPCGTLTTRPSDIGGLNIQNMQTDIIYLIEWLQSELKHKNSGLSLSDSTADISDLEFDHFISTTEAADDWVKAKEVEQSTTDALAVKVDTITSVHQEILNWWRHHEKSLAREMLSERCCLMTPKSKSFTALSPPELAYTFVSNLSIDSLMAKHSDLLKDVQLFKSRVQSAKRSVQRIKRKYMVEYKNWKRGEKQSTEYILKNLECLITTINTWIH